jgi:uncharacterized hydrophobic protein (TIGR00271 family)
MSRATPEQIANLRQALVQDSQINLDYLVLVISACIIASLGLLMNSTAVIIGAMIVAPLMMPIRGLAFGFLEGDLWLLGESFSSLSLGAGLSIVLAWTLGRIFDIPGTEFSSEIIARTQPNLADLAVAIAAGVVSGFAKIRPQIGDALAGTAIAVALMPPLCVVGIALSQGAWIASGGAFLLFFTNLLGICFACILVFVWGGYYLDAKNMRLAVRLSFTLTSLLALPLLISLLHLVKQNQLRSDIRGILKRETITVGQKAELINMNVQWNLFPWSDKPSKIILLVRSPEEITSKQVLAVEELLEKRLGQNLELIFQVIPYKEIDAREENPVTDY